MTKYKLLRDHGPHKKGEVFDDNGNSNLLYEKDIAWLSGEPTLINAQLFPELFEKVDHIPQESEMICIHCQGPVKSGTECICRQSDHIVEEHEKVCEHDWEYIGKKCSRCGDKSFTDVDELIKDLNGENVSDHDYLKSLAGKMFTSKDGKYIWGLVTGIDITAKDEEILWNDTNYSIQEFKDKFEEVL